jgi:hypothetical protein
MKNWKVGSFLTMKDWERTRGFWASYLIFSNVLRTMLRDQTGSLFFENHASK